MLINKCLSVSEGSLTDHPNQANLRQSGDELWYDHEQADGAEDRDGRGSGEARRPTRAASARLPEGREDVESTAHDPGPAHRQRHRALSGDGARRGTGRSLRAVEDRQGGWGPACGRRQTGGSNVPGGCRRGDCHARARAGTVRNRGRCGGRVSRRTSTPSSATWDEMDLEGATWTAPAAAPRPREDRSRAKRRRRRPFASCAARRHRSRTRPQTGPIPSSLRAFPCAIFSLVARGRPTARIQSAPALALAMG